MNEFIRLTKQSKSSRNAEAR